LGPILRINEIHNNSLLMIAVLTCFHFISSKLVTCPICGSTSRLTLKVILWFDQNRPTTDCIYQRTASKIKSNKLNQFVIVIIVRACHKRYFILYRLYSLSLLSSTFMHAVNKFNQSFNYSSCEHDITELLK